MTNRARKAGIAFGVLLAGAIVLVAATMGIGKPSVPENAIAFVDDAPMGEITSEELQTLIERGATAQGLPEPPQPGTPQFQQLKVQAATSLIQEAWIRAEAEEQGVEATDREVESRLQEVIDQQFGGQKEFDKFLEESNLTVEEAREIIGQQFLDACLRGRAQPQIPDQQTPEGVPPGCVGQGTVEVSDDDIQAFYDDNVAQFQTPETRDVRTILNPDSDKIDEALDRLEKSHEAADWKEVAKDLSTDEATADLGGLRTGVVEGQNEPALDEAIFSSPVGELVGPIEGDAGFYVLEVEEITEASTQELDDATRQQITQSLAAQKQTESVEAFQRSFLAEWSAQTVCSEDLLEGDDDGSVRTALSVYCSNIQPADSCTSDDEGEEPVPDPATGEVPEGCGAFVPSIPVVSPLSDTGAPLPQGPQGPPQPEDPTLDGAQQLGVPGGVPPGAVPQGGAPPGGAPQGGAPPGAPPTP